MGIFTNVQLSIFCNTTASVTPNQITKAMMELNDLGINSFLPNVVNGQNLNLLSGKVEKVTNISFISTDQKYNIACLDRRVDISYNNSINDINGLKTILEQCTKLIDSIIEIYGFTANRLAINLNILGEEHDKVLSDTKFKNLAKSLKYYDNKDIYEWSSRINTLEQIEINNCEDVNVITEITKLMTNNKILQVLTHLDINTAPTNAQFRFSKGDMSKFVGRMFPTIEELNNSFVEYDNE